MFVGFRTSGQDKPRVLAIEESAVCRETLIKNKRLVANDKKVEETTYNTMTKRVIITENRSFTSLSRMARSPGLL